MGTGVKGAKRKVVLQKRLRLSLDVSPATDDELLDLAEILDDTKSGVLRRAVSLLKVAVEARRGGKNVCLVKGDRVVSLVVL